MEVAEGLRRRHRRLPARRWPELSPSRRALLLLNPTSLQVKRAMTMTEKILAKHSDKASVAPGDNVWTNVDKLLTHDVCGPGTFGIFQKEFGEDAQVGMYCGSCVARCTLGAAHKAL